jgi:hypothetical protein
MTTPPLAQVSFVRFRTMIKTLTQSVGTGMFSGVHLMNAQLSAS